MVAIEMGGGTSCRILDPFLRGNLLVGYKKRKRVRDEMPLTKMEKTVG